MRLKRLREGVEARTDSRKRTSMFFDGDIDEVEIIGRALSPEEIRAEK